MKTSFNVPKNILAARFSCLFWMWMILPYLLVDSLIPKFPQLNFIYEPWFEYPFWFMVIVFTIHFGMSFVLPERYENV